MPTRKLGNILIVLDVANDFSDDPSQLPIAISKAVALVAAPARAPAVDQNRYLGRRASRSSHGGSPATPFQAIRTCI